MKKEEIGQFPSKDCECQWHKTYGFVPEADCVQHDTSMFIDFVDYSKNKGWNQALHKAIQVASIWSNGEENCAVLIEKLQKLHR